MRRFSETGRMDEDWYCALPLEMKAAFEFLWAKCDACGVWIVNHRLAEFQIGKKVDWKELLKRCGTRIVQLDECRYFLRDFVHVSCGRLSRECKAHNHVFAALEHNKIDAESIEKLTLLDSYPVATDKHIETKLIENTLKEGDARGRAKGTLDEFKAFAVELGLPASDGEATFNKFEGNGWRNGANAVKCWRSTMRNWFAQKFFPSQKNGAHAPARGRLY